MDAKLSRFAVEIIGSASRRTRVRAYIESRSKRRFAGRLVLRGKAWQLRPKGTIPCLWRYDLWRPSPTRNPRTLPFSPPAGRLLAVASLQKKERAQVLRCASPQGLGCGPAAMTVSPSQGIGTLRQRRRQTMTAIGFVTRTTYGGLRGQLILRRFAPTSTSCRTATSPAITQQISAYSPRDLRSESGRILSGENYGRDYISLSLAAPGLGVRKLCANLGRTIGLNSDGILRDLESCR